MFTICAVLGMVLSAVGVYAVTAYTVAQRLREIGIRIAVGARPAQVRWLLLRRVLLQAGVGLVLGIPGALVVRTLPLMVPGGVLTLVPLMLLVSTLAIAASLFSVRQAVRLDPLTTLRLE
jgi:ABC-type antimicrobial peptide transport system permease subunit